MQTQEIIVYAIVALAAGWLLWRQIKPANKGGCGGGCACPKEQARKQGEGHHPQAKQEK